MKMAAFTIGLLMSGAAFAQDSYAPTPGSEPTPSSEAISTPVTTESTTAEALPSATSPASAQMVEPSNANPERDARGILVISEAAMVPAGWNGTPGSALGGPLLDPATGEPEAAGTYPACSRTLTDNCLQTYERGRSA